MKKVVFGMEQSYFSTKGAKVNPYCETLFYGQVIQKFFVPFQVVYHAGQLAVELCSSADRLFLRLQEAPNPENES